VDEELIRADLAFLDEGGVGRSRLGVGVVVVALLLGGFLVVELDEALDGVSELLVQIGFFVVLIKVRKFDLF
jgi:hypothetical protein